MAVNIEADIFQVPTTTTDPMYAKPTPIDIPALTTKEVNGSGAFDELMASVKAHLRQEYEANRITGSEYTKAYIEMTQAALQTALQFVLGRDQAFWAAQTAQIQAITGRIGLEKARYEYTYTMPAQLLQTQAQTALVNTQKAGQEVQNQIAEFNRDYTLPAQLVLIKEQTEVQRAQTYDIRTDDLVVTGLIKRQKDLYEQQVTSYKRDAECKAAKLFTDAWVTQKTIDEGLTAPTGFTNASLDVVLGVIKANNGLT